MKSIVKAATILAVACIGTGCSGPNAFTLTGVSESFKRSFGMGDKPTGPIHRIDTIWKAAKGHDMNGMPCRGAAGQILFFSAGSAVPVKLAGEGQVKIYVFDDLGKPAERGKPLHIFKFDLGAWTSYLRVGGQLGPTYNVFIPYTRDVVTSAQMSIVVALEPKRGMRISSDSTTVALPGPNSKMGAKLEVFTDNPAKNVKVTTFKPGKYLNGVKTPDSDSAKKNDTPAGTRSSAIFHDFDLHRRTQVRSLGPVQRPFAGAGNLPNKIDRQSAELRDLLNKTRIQPVTANVPIEDRRPKLAEAPRSFRLGSAPSAAKTSGVVTAGHELDAAPAECAVDGQHPLLDGSAGLGPRRDRNVRPAEHAIPAGKDPFQNGDGSGSDATTARPPARNPLDADAAGDFGKMKSPRITHPLVDEQAAWSDN
jgi:hypothetical protein